MTAKHLLCEGSMPVHYDVKRSIKIFCDASAYGLGACLTHLMLNSDVCPIAYASQRLTGPEQNCAQVEHEALTAGAAAGVEAVREHCSHFLARFSIAALS